MRAELHDGRILEFPDGTDPEIIQNTVKKVLGVKPVEAPQYTGLSAKFPQIAEKIEGFYRGAKDPIDALAQLLHESVPEKAQQDVNALQNWVAEKTGLMEKIPEDGLSEQLRQQEKTYQTRRKAQGDEGFDWDRFAGTMATSFIPAMGAARIAAPTTVAGKIATGAGTGAAYSQLAPVYEDDFFKEKAKQAALGATIGTVIPAAAETAKLSKKIVDELTRPMHFRNVGKGLKSGIARDTSDYLEEIVDNKDLIIKALSKAKPGETSGQTLAREGVGSKIIKLEQEIAKRTPSDEAQALFKGQETARKNLIKAIAGTDDDLSTAISRRTRLSDINYKKAYKEAIKGDAKLIKLSKNPYIKKALPAASDLAKANNVDPKTNLTEFLHYIKIGIDKQLKKTGDDALTSTERGAAMTVKSQLIKWIKDKNRLYDTARRRHAKMSKPIDRMNVGKELEKGLITSTEKESAQPFLTATREGPRTIKRATGQSIYNKLEDVLTKEQMKSVKKVSDELLMTQQYKDIASKTKSPYGVLTEEAKLQIAPMLERNVMIANALLRRLGRRATPEYERVAWDILRDPTKLTKILSKPDTDKTKQLIVRLLEEEGIAVSSIIAAREIQ